MRPLPPLSHQKEENLGAPDHAGIVALGIELLLNVVVRGQDIAIDLDWSPDVEASRRAAVLEEVAGSLVYAAEVLRGGRVR